MARERSAEEQWSRGVELGATGRYGSAFAALEPLARESGRWASLASSTLGSLHRQLARYGVARGHDERARALAGADAEAMVEAHLGLAADAVGEIDPGTARAHLERARAALPGGPPTAPPTAPAGGVARGGAAGLWRVGVRAEWVGAEVALLGGDLDLARGHAHRALAGAERNRATRHVAKSLLFVAVTEPGDEGAGALRRSWRISTGNGYRPLVWPAAILAARLGGEEAARMRAEGRRAVRDICGGLDDAIALEWTSGPDLRQLLRH